MLELAEPSLCVANATFARRAPVPELFSNKLGEKYPSFHLELLPDMVAIALIFEVREKFRA